MHGKDKKTLVALTFAQLLRNLPKSNFVRVHKSYAINLKHVDLVEKNEIWIGSTALPIGQSYRVDFYRLLENDT